MVVAFIIVVLLSFGLGVYAGFRYGSLHTAKENSTLRNQLSMQERFSQAWFANATDKYALSQQIANGQTSSLNASMDVVLRLLQNVQAQQVHTQNKEEADKIERLIQQARDIASP